MLTRCCLGPPVVRNLEADEPEGQAGQRGKLGPDDKQESTAFMTRQEKK